MPGACSLAPHIVLHELGVPHKLVLVNRADKRTDDGRDYDRIVPQGYVPALQVDDGRILTEVAAIVQYLADQHPDKNLAPQNGTFERALLWQWLSFIGTELHKNFGPLFANNVPDAFKQAATTKLNDRFDIVESQLEKTAYLLGDNFTVADAYLYVVLTWTEKVNYAMDAYPSIQEYKTKLDKRPTIIEAKKDEGI